ncbi:MAG: VTC domain protein [Bacteroidetes bacterium ADurb.Bin302]|nr:MAG: VTC domain protein [Bacteroidetes bacterium ADurb.Bin302]
MISKESVLALPLWKDMVTIDLTEMKSVKLMNRVDTKFSAQLRLLPDLLSRAISDYRVQVIDNSPVASYDTLYFDTPDLQMYLRHHDKILQRDKVRTRTYIDSSLSFLEVKHKNNKGRTKKKRILISVDDFDDFTHNDEAINFLDNQVIYKIDALKPQVRTIFNRITLVNNARTERLTIDFNLRFENEQTKLTAELPDVMIIELKQDGLVYSPMKKILSDMNIHQIRISKYCIGTVLTNPNAKYNRFKKKVIFLNKLTKN